MCNEDTIVTRYWPSATIVTERFGAATFRHLLMNLGVYRIVLYTGNLL